MIVRDYLERQALARPNKVAILFKEEKITFSDLNTMSNRLANRLLAAGIKKGDRVVLLFQNCPQFCVAYFAVLKIGAIAVLLDFRLSPTEMEPLFQEAEVTAIITSVRQRVFINRAKNAVPTLKQVVVTGAEGEDIGDWHSYEEIVEKESSDQISIPLDEDDEALYLLYVRNNREIEGSRSHQRSSHLLPGVNASRSSHHGTGHIWFRPSHLSRHRTRDHESHGGIRDDPLDC